MNESILRKTKNFFRCIGELNETALIKEDCDIKLKNEDGSDNGTMRGERIRGRISVTIPTGIMTLDCFFQSNNSRGEENRTWKMAQSMLEWNPKIGGTNDPVTVVDIKGNVAINDYVGNDGEVKSGLRWNVNSASSKGNIDEAGCSLSAVVWLKGYTEEVISEEETGRLVLELYGANNQGQCFPMKAFVDEEMAEDFSEAFSQGQTLNADFDVIFRHIGAKRENTKKTFGRSASVNLNDGFDIQELIIVGADDVEEPDELTTEDENGNEVEVKTNWINPATMRKAIKARAQMLEEMKQNGGNTTTRKPAKKTSGFKAKKQDFEEVEEDDDDLPF